MSLGNALVCTSPPRCNAKDLHGTIIEWFVKKCKGLARIAPIRNNKLDVHAHSNKIIVWF
jgi:hypothetical protein